MALEIETTYTNKTGEKKKFKYPLIRVLGKNMDDGEVHKYQVLKVPEPKRYTKLDYYTMFVKIPDTDKCFVLEFGSQLKGALDSLNIRPRDIIVLTKGEQMIETTGAKQPVVNVDVANRENKAIPDKPSDQEMDGFIEAYRKQVNPSDWSVSHFVGTYIRKFSPGSVAHLEKLFKEKVEAK